MGAALEGLLAVRERAVLDDDSVRAAVLLVLYDEGDRPYLVLTKRTETVAHPGQISLPGGRLEPDDPSLCHAAVRETEEEIGVPARALRVVGALDDVHTMASNFAITPFVAVLEGPFAATPADDEVALVIEIPVEDLLEADARLPEGVGGLELRYPLADEDVWGATARILRNFARLTRCALGPGGVSPGPPPDR
jgi:8-oxo-dGTP pyrophosphatase MutT (NUDIX family)